MPGSHHPVHRTLMQLNNDDNDYELVAGLTSSLCVAIVVTMLSLLMMFIVYCCIVRYKRFTSVRDPPQTEPINPFEEDIDNRAVTTVTRSPSDNEGTPVELSTRWYSISTLISEPPPDYNNGPDYPFSPTPLPSYDTISQSSKATGIDLEGTGPITSSGNVIRQGEIRLVTARRSVLIVSNNSAVDNNADDELCAVNSITSYHFEYRNDSSSESDEPNDDNH